MVEAVAEQEFMLVWIGPKFEGSSGCCHAEQFEPFAIGITPEEKRRRRGLVSKPPLYFSNKPTLEAI
jgi:hypothetical protein